MKRRSLIAVVDDSISVCRALRRLLQTAGMDALCYESAAEFLAEGVCHRPDLAILDIHMPGTNGLELCAQLRRCEQHLPIIFITAHHDPALKDKLLNEAAVDYVPKPFTDQQIIASIGRLLAAGAGAAPASSPPGKGGR